jgi:hypothetical protein
VVHGCRDVALRGGERLAVVERLELGELLAVLLDQLGERVHDRAALGGAELAKRAIERGPSRFDGARHVLGAAVGDLGDRLAGGGVEGRERPIAGRLEPLTVDQVPARRSRDEVAGCLGERIDGGGGHRRIVPRA